MNVEITATGVYASECIEVSRPEGTYFFVDDQCLPADFAKSPDGSAAHECLLRAGVSYVLCTESVVRVFADHRGWNHLYLHRGPSAPVELIVADNPFAFAGRCSIDWETLRLVPLLGYVPPPLSPLRGVNRLLPGERLTFDRSTLAESSRDNCLVGLVEPVVQPEQADALIGETLRSATAARISETDEPVVFLSGGFDSSLLVHLLQSNAAAPVTWTASYASHLGKRESVRAAAAARHFGVPWTEVAVGDSQVAEHLPGIMETMHEPFADVATLAEAVLARQVAQTHGSARVFEGEAMDSLMCGSYKFIAERYRHLLTPMLSLLPSSLLGREERTSRVGSLGLKFRQLKDILKGGSPVDRHVRFLYSEVAGVAIDPETEASVWRAFKGYHDLLPEADTLTRLSCMTLFGEIPNLANRKLRLIERYSGVKFELVYQDIEFVRLALTLPANRKVVRGYGKYAVRRTFADALPPAVKGRAKLSFVFPIIDYLSEDMVERLSDERLVPVETVRRVVEEHRTGRADHLAFLWGVHVANGWARRYEEASSRAATPGYNRC